ncbi:hypothetical protein AGMMS49975_10480 [Clostridia bacterium]|nr:hypothetical protein AGMMS49975_10480 [Clostridia bacterium]
MLGFLTFIFTTLTVLTVKFKKAYAEFDRLVVWGTLGVLVFIGVCYVLFSK